MNLNHLNLETLQKSSLAFNVTLQISSSSLDPLQLGRTQRFVSSTVNMEVLLSHIMSDALKIVPKTVVKHH